MEMPTSDSSGRKVRPNRPAGSFPGDPRAAMISDDSRETILPLVRDALREDREVQLHVISESMHPLLETGDTVYVRALNPQTARVGDIIIFEKQGIPITHRLLRAGPLPWMVKGDRALRADPPLHEGDLIGKVTRIHKRTTTVNLETRSWRWANRLFARVQSARMNHHSARDREGKERAGDNLLSRAVSKTFQVFHISLMTIMLSVNRTFYE